MKVISFFHLLSILLIFVNISLIIVGYRLRKLRMTVRRFCHLDGAFVCIYILYLSSLPNTWPGVHKAALIDDKFEEEYLIKFV